MQDVDAQKPKRSPSRQWGCLKLLLIPILLALACHGGMWLFAHYGGEWVAQQVIPLPPGSQEVKTSEYEADYGFICRLGVYLYDGDSQELREWFMDHGIGLTPILINAETNVYADHEDYYSNFLDTYWTPLYWFHNFSIYTVTSWYQDMNPPHRLRIYKTRETFLKYYPEITPSDGVSGFEMGLCRPDIEGVVAARS